MVLGTWPAVGIALLTSCKNRNGLSRRMSEFYVYRWIRLDSNTPFYVGKGKGRRASSRQRNSRFLEIYRMVPCEVGIFIDGLTESEAYEKEIEFIATYKKLGMCEANITNGGGNPFGRVFSAEHRAKLSAAAQGRKVSQETKAKISATLTGTTLSLETKAKISTANSGERHHLFGKSHSDETKEKLSIALTGRTISDRQKAQISAAKSGVNHHNYGKPCPPETKAKISATLKERASRL